MTEPKLYRKRPTQIEAMFWNGENTDRIVKWCGVYYDNDLNEKPVFAFPGAVTWGSGVQTADLWVEANQSIITVAPNNWTAKDKLGFYPISSEVFGETYFSEDDEEA